MNSAHSSACNRQTGLVLVVSLIFLLVLTLVAVVATQSTTMEERMSANDVFKSRAMESSESLRTSANDLVDATLFYGGWPTTVTVGASTGTLNSGLFTIPPGVTIKNLDNWGIANTSTEDIFTPSTLKLDMTLTVDSDGDGNYTGPLDQSANLYIYKTLVTLAPGSSTAMVAGYEGTGKSSAVGGSYIFYDMRSVGSPGSARAITYSNYRYVVR